MTTKKSFIFGLIILLLFLFQIVGSGQVFEGNDKPADLKNITGLYHPRIDGIIDTNSFEWADSSLLTSDFDNKDNTKSFVKSWAKIVSDSLYLAVEINDDLKKIGIQFDMDNNGILSDGDVLLTVINGNTTIGKNNLARFSLSSLSFSEVTGLDIFSNGQWDSLADPRPSPIFKFNFGSSTKENQVSTSSNTRTKITKSEFQNVEVKISLAELGNFVNPSAGIARFSIKSSDQKSPGLSSIGIALMTETSTGIKAGFPSKPESTTNPLRESLPSFSQYLFDNTLPTEFSVDIGIDHVEIGQAIQTPLYSSSLVKDKLTLVRIFTKNLGFIPVNTVVQISGLIYDGVNYFELGSTYQQFLAPTSNNPNDLSSTANFVLPAIWTHFDNLHLQVSINPIGKTDTSTSDNEMVSLIPFKSTKNQNIFIVKVNSGNQTDPVTTSDVFIDVQTSATNGIFPVAHINSPILGWGTLGVGEKAGEDLGLQLSETFNVLQANTKFARTLDPSYSVPLPDQLYAFNPNGESSSYPSWVGGISTVGSGYFNVSKEFTMAHELNHNYGPRTWGAHVSSEVIGDYGCAAPNPDIFWQSTRTDDTIGVLGWNPLYGLIDESTPDLMSNCASPNFPTKWISDYRWERLVDLFENQFNSNVNTNWNNVPMSELLVSKARVISGIIKNTSEASFSYSLSYSYAYPGYSEYPDTVNRTTEPFCLEISTENGSNACIPLDPVFGNTDGVSDTYLFSFLLPEINSTSTISIINNTDGSSLLKVSKTNFTVTGDVNVPTIQSGLLTNISWNTNISRSGSKLAPIKYYLQYTPDRKNWLPLGNPTTNTSQLVSFDNLPGGSVAKVRLIVTDGVQSEILLSDTLSIPTNKPEIVIDTNKYFKQYIENIGGSIINIAENNTVNHKKINLGSIFSTSAHSYDLEDGIISGNFLNWTLTPVVGSSPSIIRYGSIFSHVFNETGTFNLTVSATDSHNQTSQDTLIIEVLTSTLFDNQTYTQFQDSLKSQRDSYPKTTTTETTFSSSIKASSSSSEITTTELTTLPLIFALISSVLILKKKRRAV
jgi:hypothetical protein